MKAVTAPKAKASKCLEFHKASSELLAGDIARAKRAEARDLIDQVKALTARNAEITKAGNWFTPEQIANESKVWKMKMELRHKHGMEPGTY